MDELIQLAHNADPLDGTEQDCEQFYYALQNANFNVLGLIAETGEVVERYEYTPYGQRTVYTTAGSADPAAHTPTLMSQRVELASVAQPYALNPLGHQGKMHDEVAELIYYNARYLHPRAGRFITRDPIGYPDGMNAYEAMKSSPLCYIDPLGTECYFIAIGDREVGGTGTSGIAGFYHYSVEKWSSVAWVEVGDQFTSMTQQKQLGLERKDSWELLADESYSVWVGRSGYHLGGGNYGPFVWDVKALKFSTLWGGVSVVHHGSATSNRIVVAYVGHKDEIDRKWEEVSQLARQYPYAEQANFGGTFRKWPQSWYQLPGFHSPGNNSNTFVRHIARSANIGMKELSGAHPGANSPSRIQYQKNGWFLFRGQPFPTNGPVPPRP